MDGSEQLLIRTPVRTANCILSLLFERWINAWNWFTTEERMNHRGGESESWMRENGKGKYVLRLLKVTQLIIKSPQEGLEQRREKEITSWASFGSTGTVLMMAEWRPFIRRSKSVIKYENDRCFRRKGETIPANKKKLIDFEGQWKYHRMWLSCFICAELTNRRSWGVSGR